MSDHRVEVVEIDDILEHPNADRLEIAQILGWQSVVQKGEFRAGDSAVYIPIDSILDEKLEGLLFPEGSIITLSKHRVKTIRLRKAFSQGMLINHRDENLLRFYPKLRGRPVGVDVAEILNITKYEPPAPAYAAHQAKKGSRKNHPSFVKYTDIQNLKYYPELFKTEEPISITEKLHGTSARYAKYERNMHTRLGWITRLLVKLGLKTKHEFVYGSRNVQLQTGGKLYYRDRHGKPINVYARIAEQYNLSSVLQPGEALYGEIVGPGIQKGYDYGYKEEGAYGFYAYDVRVGDKYLDPVEFRDWCWARSIPVVPLLFEGYRRAVNFEEIVLGASELASRHQPVREGVVIKPLTEGASYMGRKVLKAQNPIYLLGDQTDFH